jgi:hypothetical protein
VRDLANQLTPANARHHRQRIDDLAERTSVR